MKRNSQRLAMTGSLSTYTAAGAQRSGRMSGIESPRIFLAVLTALALVMGTMVPAAFADTGADATSTTETTTTGSVFASGTGTQTDPYTIETLAQLEAFRDAVNAGTAYKGEYVQLNADITLAATDWTPIGSGARSGNAATANATPFEGTFLGNNHTVSGLTITASSPLAANASNALGFFGVLDGAYVNNLTLANVSIDVPTSQLAGALAGLALDDTVLSNIQVTGTVSGDSNIGGVLGCMIGSGAVVGSKNEAAVSGTGSNIGGIVGSTVGVADEEIRLTVNTNTGDVSGADAVGGIVGHNDAQVGLNTNTGKVAATSASAGQIVGSEGTYSVVQDTNHSNATDPETPAADATETDQPTTDDDTTPTASGDPITGPAVGSPNDSSATQQAGTASPTTVADNTTQTGASLQQTGDDALRIAGVAVVIALTAGLTLLVVRRRSL